ncbi:hypothetical protein OQA88_9957 [Cercophora sp. LCS_1]
MVSHPNEPIISPVTARLPNAMELLIFNLQPGLALLLLAIVTLLTLLLLRTLYQLHIHPLSIYPGPTLWSLTRIPLARAQLSGNAHTVILSLHKKYGDIVRIAPDELSYSHPAAWDEIYGPRRKDRAENAKDHVFYFFSRENIVGSGDEDHARLRKILGSAFSLGSIVGMEGFWGVYVNQLITQLSKFVTEKDTQPKKPVELTSWLNFMTFDVISDLVFGESFGMVATGKYHPWVEMVLVHNRDVLFFNATKYLSPLLAGLLGKMVPKSVREKAREHGRMTHAMVERRKALGTERVDIMSAMLGRGGKQGMTDTELDHNASLLVIAGAESTATTTCVAIYHLTRTPRAMRRLVDEVRGAFEREEDIKLVQAQQLPYLSAVIEETLRLHPPNPAGLPRRAPKGGTTVLGRYVPEGALMSVWQWPQYHSSKWYHEPDSFFPERWLADKEERFKGDALNGVNPFVTGPRDCAGRNLAYAEVRLAMCRIFWKWDVELAEDSENWVAEQKSYLVWQKGPLNVYLTSRSQRWVPTSA